MTEERREALARLIDPDSWDLSDDPRYDKLPEEARTGIRKPSLKIADRIMDSGILAAHEWDRAEFIKAQKYLMERTSRRGYCYDVEDGLDGSTMHDPRCNTWPQSYWGVSSDCIRQGRR